MPMILFYYDIRYKNGDYVILYYLFTWKCQLAKMFEIETQIVFGNVTCVVMIWVWKKFHLLQFCDDHYDQKIAKSILNF